MNPQIVRPRHLSNPDLNEEYVELVYPNGKKDNLFLHNYKSIFRNKGLFERIFLETLNSTSHIFVCERVLETIQSTTLKPSSCRILELGAGNGVTAEVFKQSGFNHIIGVDKLTEAKDAAVRDRPDVYDDYLVVDLARPSAKELNQLEAQECDILLIVAAIGMEHLDALSLVTGFNLIRNGGVIVFNIYSKLLSHSQTSEFDTMIDQFKNHSRLLLRQEYVHRKSVTDHDVNYILFIFEKTHSIPNL